MISIYMQVDRRPSENVSECRMLGQQRISRQTQCSLAIMYAEQYNGQVYQNPPRTHTSQVHYSADCHRCARVSTQPCRHGNIIHLHTQNPSVSRPPVERLDAGPRLEPSNRQQARHKLLGRGVGTPARCRGASHYAMALRLMVVLSRTHHSMHAGSMTCPVLSGNPTALPPPTHTMRPPPYVSISMQASSLGCLDPSTACIL